MHCGVDISARMQIRGLGKPSRPFQSGNKRTGDMHAHANPLLSPDDLVYGYLEHTFRKQFPARFLTWHMCLALQGNHRFARSVSMISHIGGHITDFLKTWYSVALVSITASVAKQAWQSYVQAVPRGIQ